jgi:hypothetical protein
MSHGNLPVGKDPLSGIGLPSDVGPLSAAPGAASPMEMSFEAPHAAATVIEAMLAAATARAILAGAARKNSQRNKAFIPMSARPQATLRPGIFLQLFSGANRRAPAFSHLTRREHDLDCPLDFACGWTADGFSHGSSPHWQSS